ncbi:MAG: hypothetical protein N2652_02270 [Kiritimatiellae bacterium]|nr:hypothetical protein [Kiritimatiellia bacterium]
MRSRSGLRIQTGLRALAMAMVAAALPTMAAPPLLLSDEYPRVFFFRAAEGAARRAADYESWSAEFSRLMGIIGKCLDEEIVGHMARNPEFFRRFKTDHPRQLVLLHLNGNARDPRFETAHWFAGHWVYRTAATILSDVPAEPGETTIRVSDASLFRVNTGRYRTSNDDIALFRIGPDGRHDWAHAEQTQLISVDTKAGTIRVRRGCYGTRPLAFTAGCARAAAHESEGPWGRNNHLLWFYNYSTHCPRDAEGKTAADRFIEDIARWFAPGGPLHGLDGLEFDVLFSDTQGDTDGDGVADDGMVGGVNHYGIGVCEFARRLRERMGRDFLLMADGALGAGGSRSQRAIGSFNGIESEGWPNLGDWAFNDWSGGLHRHRFWQAHAHPPPFSYINHKWIEPVAGQPGETRHPDVPFSRHRLVFAAAQMVDAALCYSFPPPRRGRDRQYPIWDELIAGTECTLGWLGRPEGPAIALATNEANIWPARPPRPIAPGCMVADTEPAGWTISPSGTNGSAGDVGWRWDELPTRGSNLVIVLELSGAAMPGYPDAMPRLAKICTGAAELELSDRAPDGVTVRRRDDTAERPAEPASGAFARRLPRAGDGTNVWPAILSHPPFRDRAGAVIWHRDVELPDTPRPELRWRTMLSATGAQKSDGVIARVELAELRDGSVGEPRVLFEETVRHHGWAPRSVPLAEWRGRRVRLRFVTDCGPRDHAVADQLYWGDVRVLDERAGRTPPQRWHLWVSRTPFLSTLYVRHIGSGTLSLQLRVEGGAAVTVHSLRAHPAPDVMVRVFERGLVLANPATHPVTVDLATLSPGRSYQRLKGSAGQDRTVNNGRPVGRSVTLGPLDGLFLQRVEAGAAAPAP